MKFIRLFLSSELLETSSKIPQQINCKKKLGEEDNARMFFIAGNQQKTILNFSLDSLIVSV